MLTCPFCPASVGAHTETQILGIKIWMGKHLALKHADLMERVLELRTQGEQEPRFYLHQKQTGKYQGFRRSL